MCLMVMTPLSQWMGNLAWDIRVSSAFRKFECGTYHWNGTLRSRQMYALPHWATWRLPPKIFLLYGVG